MKSHPRHKVLLLASALLCLTSGAALACACCSEENQRFSDRGKTSEQQLAEMQQMKFGPEAKFFLGAGDEADVRGVRNVAPRYRVTPAWDERQWKLTFRSEAGETGVLTLPLAGGPMSTSKVDIHDGRTSAGGGPLLFKEWRFEGRATGDGIFQPGFAAPARFVLVFQGRGNNCDSAADFTHWWLEINGSKAAFTVVGEMAAAE